MKTSCWGVGGSGEKTVELRQRAGKKGPPFIEDLRAVTAAYSSVWGRTQNRAMLDASITAVKGKDRATGGVIRTGSRRRAP